MQTLKIKPLLLMSLKQATLRFWEKEDYLINLLSSKPNFLVKLQREELKQLVLNFLLNYIY